MEAVQPYIHLSTTEGDAPPRFTICSLSRHRVDGERRLAAASVFPLPAVDVESRERDTADGRRQQEPDEDLSEDGILHHH